MLIRSQDKMFLVKFENIVININNINDKEIICWSQMNPREDEYIPLGHYSTKAKSMKVLDMIQEVYERYEYENVFKTGLTLFETFQIPEDSEVEV